MNGLPVDIRICRRQLKHFLESQMNGQLLMNMVFKGTRVVIANNWHSDTLERLRTGHMRMNKCKQRARKVVSWPGLNHDIVDLVKH